MDVDRDQKPTVRELDTNVETPAVAVAEVVAELKGVSATDIASTYGCVDEVLAHLFSDPPSSEAEMQVAFTYEGYRVTVEQDGTAAFVPVE